jgi:hypothetical protein
VRAWCRVNSLNLLFESFAATHRQPQTKMANAPGKPRLPTGDELSAGVIYPTSSAEEDEADAIVTEFDHRLSTKLRACTFHNLSTTTGGIEVPMKTAKTNLLAVEKLVARSFKVTFVERRVKNCNNHWHAKTSDECDCPYTIKHYYYVSW